MVHYFGDIWQAVSSAFKGMGVTIKHIVRKPVTLQYPDERWVFPERFRGFVHNDIIRCNACMQCARSCPVSCIYIETDGKGKDRYMTRWAVDFNKCIWCGFCCDPCPTEAVTMSHDYDHSLYFRQSLVYEYVPADNPVPCHNSKRAEMGYLVEKDAKPAAATSSSDKPAPKPAAEGSAPAAAEPTPPPDREGGEPVISFWVFAVFALLTVGSAFLVVFSRNIVHAGFSLLFTLFGVAGLYAILGADFLAVTQVVVYIGGILVLVLFTVMMTRIPSGKIRRRGMDLYVPAGIFALVLFGLLYKVVTSTVWPVREPTAAQATTAEIGTNLMTSYLFPFEYVSLLLLVAMVGAALLIRESKQVSPRQEGTADPDPAGPDTTGSTPDDEGEKP